jgi:GTP cyclohydrolase I
MQIKKLTNNDITVLAEKLSLRIRAHNPGLIYGVPRGGVPVAYLLSGLLGCRVTDHPERADVIVDDIIASGATLNHFCGSFPHTPFYALINQQDPSEADAAGVWFVFPWEESHNQDASATDIPLRLLQRIGENPMRDGLKDTPARVVRSWDELYKGYKEDPNAILARVFDNEEHYDEMVLLRDIEYYSTCEHHMLPFFGRIHVAYIPAENSGRIVGVSKLARLVDCFARRLQVQERLTQQIANAIDTALSPRGVAVYCEGQHLCMLARGVRQHESVMVTSALRGVCLEQAARMEFLLLSSGRGR